MKKALLFGLVLALMAIPVFAGGSSEGASSAASETITIAFIGNTTGDYAMYGVPVRNSVVMFFEQLNAAGGINGKQVKLLEYDDNMPQISASATNPKLTVMDPDDPKSEVKTNVFRTCFLDPFQGEKMAQYAAQVYGAKTIAIFYENGSEIGRAHV